MRKNRKELHAFMERHGFVLTKQNKHLHWRHAETGGTLTTSSTASDANYLWEIRRMIRRMGIPV